jgi:spore coat polysaccharide biosynthesis protein SpsF
MLRIGVIILCRFNSTRLPGKVLMHVDSKPILKHTVDGWKSLVPDLPLIVATSIHESDNPIAAFCTRENIPCFRGDLDDVAGRFLACARENNLDVAIRFNGDNFFLDKNLIPEFVRTVRSGGYSFYSNVKDRTYPRGMSLEAVDVGYLNQQMQFFKEARYREHVTLYFYENPPEKSLYFYNNVLPKAGGVQLAVDTQEDFIRVKKMYSQLQTNVADLRSIYQSYLKAG